MLKFRKATKGNEFDLKQRDTLEEYKEYQAFYSKIYCQIITLFTSKLLSFSLNKPNQLSIKNHKKFKFIEHENISDLPVHQ